jgi:hypothetical protein
MCHGCATLAFEVDLALEGELSVEHSKQKIRFAATDEQPHTDETEWRE